MQPTVHRAGVHSKFDRELVLTPPLSTQDEPEEARSLGDARSQVIAPQQPAPHLQLLLRIGSTVKLQESNEIACPLQFREMAKKKAADDSPLTPLGQRIMKAAEEAGFTQTSLERAAEFSGGYLTKLLKQPVRKMDFEYFQKLCELLSVRAEWLAFNREPMREGQGPLPPVDEAIVSARRLGNVTEDVFWYVRMRERHHIKDWGAGQWLAAFLGEHQKRVDDPRHAKQAKRIAMPSVIEQAPPEAAPPPSAQAEPPKSKRATQRRRKAG